MKKRRRLSKKANRRNFARTAKKTHIKNLTAKVRRGGIRL